MKQLFYLLVVCSVATLQADYQITNQTNYPAKVSLTLICTWSDGQSDRLKETTIELDFKPKESKNVPQSCKMQSMSAILNMNGSKYSTGVFTDPGQISGVNSSSWEISDSVENQYSGFKPFIRISP
jgi:hypothetical protein